MVGGMVGWGDEVGTSSVVGVLFWIGVGSAVICGGGGGGGCNIKTVRACKNNIVIVFRKLFIVYFSPTITNLQILLKTQREKGHRMLIPNALPFAHALRWTQIFSNEPRLLYTRVSHFLLRI